MITDSFNEAQFQAHAEEAFPHESLSGFRKAYVLGARSAWRKAEASHTPAVSVEGEKAANMKYGSSPDCDTAERWRDAFLAGMEAEHEVAFTYGALATMKVVREYADARCLKDFDEMVADAEKDLAALLEGR